MSDLSNLDRLDGLDSRRPDPVPIPPAVAEHAVVEVDRITRAVKALHRPSGPHQSCPCDRCRVPYCNACSETYPCRTVQALTPSRFLPEEIR